MRYEGRSAKRAPEASIREGPEELTFRIEEVCSKKSCINVDHNAQDRWGPPLVDADWHTISTKVSKEETGNNYTIAFKK